MKKAVNKIIDIGYKFLLIFTIVCLTSATIGGVFFYVNRSYCYLNPLVLIIGIIIYFLLIYKLYRFVIRLSDKKKKVTVAILLLTQFVLLTISTIFIKSVPKVDLIHIISAINGLNETGTIINNHYFSVYPNNRFLVIILYNLQRINPEYSYLFYNFFSCIGIIVMSYFTYKTVKEIGGIDKAILSLFICVLSPIFYLYVSYYYTDILMLPWASILIYLVVKMRQNIEIKSNILYGLLIGFLSVIAYKIRAVSIFILIAYLVYIFISLNLKRITIKIIPIFIAVFLTFLGTKYIEKMVFTDIDYDAEFPVTHWMMMGLNAKNKGYYSQDDFYLSDNANNVEERIEINISEIKKRINDLGPFGLLKLYINKLNAVWSKGDYSYQKYLELVADYNISYRYLVEDKNLILNYILQISKLGSLIGTIVSLCLLLKRKEKSIVAIAIFGATFFYLIWEASPRYSLSFLPWLVILGSYSYDKLKFGEYIKYKYKWSKYLIISLTIVILILNFNKYTNETLKTNIVSKDTTKKILYVELNKNVILEQTLTLNSKFNIINLTFNNDELDDSIYKLELINESGKIIYQINFSEQEIQDGVTTFNLDKQYDRGIYKFRLTTSDEGRLEVASVFKTEFDFYPGGKLIVNGEEQTSDLLFEIINLEKRGVYTIPEYMLICILIMFLEYVALFRWEKAFDEEV